MDYHNHLISVIEPFATADVALLDCKRRFKNLPDRHFTSVEALVRQHFRQDRSASLGFKKELRFSLQVQFPPTRAYSVTLGVRS